MNNYTTHTSDKMVFVTLDRMSAIRLAMTWAFTEEWVTSKGEVITGEDELDLLVQELEYSHGYFLVSVTGEGRNTLGQGVWSNLQLEKGRIVVLNEEEKPVEVLYGSEFSSCDLEDLVRRVKFLSQSGVRTIKVHVGVKSINSTNLPLIRGFLELIMADKFSDGYWGLDLSLMSA